MSNTIHRGRVSFVNHEKKYIIIEYEVNGRKKVANGSIDEKLFKKKVAFHIGDTVSFNAGLSGRGDRMVATNIHFLYNNALDVLINKAKTENHFSGYLKIADDKYFVKEIDSYLFFPVLLSPWQLKPKETELNEVVSFSLNYTGNKEKITVSLFSQKFIPEYYTAEKAFKKKEIIEARVYKITAFGTYLNVIGDNIQAKIPAKTPGLPVDVKKGDNINIRITFLSKMKIIVEPAL